MGWAARVGSLRWAWIYRQPLWRRAAIAARWFRDRRARRMFRGGFWRWLRHGGRPPQWDPVTADRDMIRAAQRQARAAGRLAAKARQRAR